ncbi:MAG: alpha-D-ribose 1-methylphosphonate 5-triphosphate diphosphatase [Hyphomicrobiaceae bacterium]
MSNRALKSRPGTTRIASSSIVLANDVMTGTVVIEAGVIVGIEAGCIDPRAEDWGDDHLIPGLIELHTDHLEPHYSPRPKVFWDPLSAVLSYDAQIATSGITTVFDSLRAGSDGDRRTLAGGLFDLASAIDTARSGGLLRVEHRTHLRCEICSNDVLEETERFMANHPVHLMSLMDHTPGVRQFRDEVKLREYYRGKSSKTEAEMDAFIVERKRSAVQNHDRHRRTLVAAARDRGVMLASHDDTTTEHVRESLADGARLAEFPTTTEAAEASHRAGIAVMMGAPNVVRGGSHSGNVAARELAERGLLDVLSSDYVPASLLQGALMLADVPAIGGLAGALRLVSKAPAEAMGLNDRGEIAVGRRADLVRVDISRAVPVVREVFCAGTRVA